MTCLHFLTAGEVLIERAAAQAMAAVASVAVKVEGRPDSGSSLIAHEFVLSATDVARWVAK